MMRIPRAKPMQIRLAVFIPRKVHNLFTRACGEHAPISRPMKTNRRKRQNIVAGSGIDGKWRAVGSNEFSGTVVLVNAQLVVWVMMFCIEISSSWTYFHQLRNLFYRDRRKFSCGGIEQTQRVEPFLALGPAGLEDHSFRF